MAGCECGHADAGKHQPIARVARNALEDPRPAVHPDPASVGGAARCHPRLVDGRHGPRRRRRHHRHPRQPRSPLDHRAPRGQVQPVPLRASPNASSSESGHRPPPTSPRSDSRPPPISSNTRPSPSAASPPRLDTTPKPPSAGRFPSATPCPRRDGGGDHPNGSCDASVAHKDRVAATDKETSNSPARRLTRCQVSLSQIGSPEPRTIRRLRALGGRIVPVQPADEDCIEQLQVLHDERQGGVGRHSAPDDVAHRAQLF